MANSANPDQLASSEIFWFVLRFYSPVNPMGSCQARSVYLTTSLLGRLSPLSGYPVLCTFFCQKPTDLDLHCLQRQGISGFSRTRVKLLEYTGIYYMMTNIYFL